MAKDDVFEQVVFLGDALLLLVRLGIEAQTGDLAGSLVELSEEIFDILVAGVEFAAGGGEAIDRGGKTTQARLVAEALEALGLKVLDENGRLVTVTMGSYGIGVSRAVAAVAEQHVAVGEDVAVS